jgi:ABC-2 type transport system ATP-binding protein
VLRHDAGIFLIGLDHYADLEALLAALRTEGIPISELALQEADLEQVFLRIMGGERPADKLPVAA